MLSAAAGFGLLLLSVSPLSYQAAAQATPSAPSGTRVLGTLLTRTSTSLTVKPDSGVPVTLALTPETSVLRLPPNSTDLKTAEPATLSDLDPADRVLVLLASDASSPTARRVLVMKGGALAAQQQTAQQGWAHSRSGVVEAVDNATGTITLKSGGRSQTINTTPSTIVRRYAAGSVRFEDAKRTSLSSVQAGDQLRVRGSSTSPATISADELVFGSFTQLAGQVTSVDPATSQLVLQDAKAKSPVTVVLGDHTEVRHLTPELARQLAARSRATGHGSAHQASAVGAQPTAAQPPADPAEAIAQLPTLPASSLKAGDAVLLVATSGADHVVTAVSVLTGAAPVLAAMESGGGTTSLSAWSLGGAETSSE